METSRGEKILAAHWRDLRHALGAADNEENTDKMSVDQIQKETQLLLLAELIDVLNDIKYEISIK